MIIGNGLLGSAFIEFDLPEVVFFASGVSNSSEISEKEFNREENLIHKILGDNPQKQFVYFSTCSIYDSSKNGSPYVLHKLKMEQIIINKASNYLILRVSNAVGKGGNPNLLMNYIYSSILNKKKITIHKNAKRNLIDVEDVVKISHNIISNNIKNKIINIDTVVENTNTRFNTENISSSAFSFPSFSLFSLYRGINTEPKAPSPKSCVKKLEILNAPKYASVIPVAPKKLPIRISLTKPKTLLSILIIITNKLDLNII